MQRSAAQISSASASRSMVHKAKARAAAADNGRQIEVYRGTKSDQVKVGG